MKVIGLTGSVGMGKTTAAKILRRLGIPVHDADREVHRLLGPGGAAVEAVAAAFPGVRRDHAIDRAVGALFVRAADILRVGGSDRKLKVPATWPTRNFQLST